MGSTSRRNRAKTIPASKLQSILRSNAEPRRARQSPPQIRRADQSKVGFGDLPAELRNQIYEIALTPSTKAAIRIVQQPSGPTGRRIAFGLLGSCKAVRKEAWSLFYEHNIFRIDCLQAMTINYSHDRSYGTGPWRDHLIISGYEEVSKSIPRIKNYEPDLDIFIASTNHVRGLQSVRCMSFAYYSNRWRATAETVGIIQDFPEHADLVLVFKLLSTAPFFSVTVDHALSNEQRPDGWNPGQRTAKWAEIAEDVQRFMGIKIDPLNGPKKMCKDIMVEFMEQSYLRCRGALECRCVFSDCRF